MEIWKDIKNWEGYYKISNKGRVFSVRNNLIRRNSVASTGYHQVCLSSPHKKITLTIHRLVAEHFIPQENERNYVNHIDGDKANNSVNNLEWCTQKENILHSYAIGLSKNQKNDKKRSRPVLQYTLDFQLIGYFPSLIEVERQTGINRTSVRLSANGKYKTGGGYVWRYAKQRQLPPPSN